MKCATCKHWKNRDDWHAEKVGFKWCERIRPRWKIEDDVPQEIRHGRYDRGEPTEKLYDQAVTKVFSKELAYVQDGSEYVAELLTAADFGCVLHEASQKETESR